MMVSIETALKRIERCAWEIGAQSGPIITYAGSSINGDYLHICFSEPIKSETINGHLLKLLKNGNEINLNTVNVIITGDTIILHLLNSGTEQPVIGDMVYINTQGPIVDLNGNHAHPDNKPVQIFQIQDTPIIPKDIKPITIRHPIYELYNVLGQKINSRLLKIKPANIANNLLLKVEINGSYKALLIK